jgi:hypothetical protein
MAGLFCCREAKARAEALRPVLVELAGIRQRHRRRTERAEDPDAIWRRVACGERDSGSEQAEGLTMVKTDNVSALHLIMGKVYAPDACMRPPAQCVFRRLLRSQILRAGLTKPMSRIVIAKIVQPA